jgi:hypothetical protein
MIEAVEENDHPMGARGIPGPIGAGYPTAITTWYTYHWSTLLKACHSDEKCASLVKLMYDTIYEDRCDEIYRVFHRSSCIDLYKTANNYTNMVFKKRRKVIKRYEVYESIGRLASDMNYRS